MPNQYTQQRNNVHKYLSTHIDPDEYEDIRQNDGLLDRAINIPFSNTAYTIKIPLMSGYSGFTYDRDLITLYQQNRLFFKSAVNREFLSQLTKGRSASFIIQTVVRLVVYQIFIHSRN